VIQDSTNLMRFWYLFGFRRYRRERRARHLAPNAVAVLLDQFDPQFADVLGNPRHTSVHRVERQQRLGADLDVPLPSAREALTIIGNHQLPRSPTPDSQPGRRRLRDLQPEAGAQV
jgi:hypothetical protein